MAEPAPTNQRLTVVIPPDLAPNQPLPLDVSISVRRDGKRSRELSAPFDAPPTPTSERLQPEHARVGQTVLMSGTQLSLEPTFAKPTITLGGRPAELVGQPTSEQVRFKVPPVPDGPGIVTLTKSPAPAMEAPVPLVVEPDIPRLDIPATPEARLGQPLTLSGRHFYAVRDLAEDGTPTPNPASPPTVHIDWVDANNQRGQQDLVPDAQPRPSDTQLTVTIPPDLAAAAAPPLKANLSVLRDNLQSNQVAMTIA